MAPAKPTLHPLQTPKSATFPSELHKSPLPGTPVAIKQEDGLATPITPPVAYTEFLKTLTPVLTSPLSANSNFASFRTDSPKKSPQSFQLLAGSSLDRHKSLTSPLPSSSAPLRPGPLRSAPLRSAPLRSSRTPTGLRRLRIPPSPTYSPVSESPMSAMTIRSPFSAVEWYRDGKFRQLDGPKSATVQPVNVRQVVTRTVTYKRTPLDPAPKGKRKRTSE
jgi:hypothetical protein